MHICPDIFGGGGIFAGTSSVTTVSGGTFIESNKVCEPSDPCNGSIALPLNDSTTFYGGGIYVLNGALTVEESTIQFNEVHARDPGFEMSFRGHGGGIQADCYGTALVCLDVSYSTIFDNLVSISGESEGEMVVAAAHGAAISMAGPEPPQTLRQATIVNSTIKDNDIVSTVTGDGCPLAPEVGSCKTGGGAIWYKVLDLDVRWTTIEGNSGTSNGVVDGGGILTTISPSPPVLTLRSTIMADNTANGVKSNIVFNGSQMTSDGNNLFDDNPDGDVGSDQIMKRICFGAFGIHDGLTETLPPARCDLPNQQTWAFDMGGALEVTDDQRRHTRPEGAAPDVGAYECESTDCLNEPAPGSGAGIGLPTDGFGSNSWEVSNESGPLFDQDRNAFMPAETPVAPVKSAMVFSGSVSRALPIRSNADALWHDALLTLGI